MKIGIGILGLPRTIVKIIRKMVLEPSNLKMTRHTTAAVGEGQINLLTRNRTIRSLITIRTREDEDKEATIPKTNLELLMKPSQNLSQSHWRVVLQSDATLRKLELERLLNTMKV